MLQEWAWIYFKTTSELSLLNFFYVIYRTLRLKKMVNKRATLTVSPKLSIYLKYLHQDQNVSIRSLSRRYPQFSLPTIWRHPSKKTEVHPKQTKGKGGRKSKLTKRDERSLIRALHYARKQDGNFTSKRIKLYSGNSSVHDRTVRRVLNKYGYHYRQARSKGLLTENCA